MNRIVRTTTLANRSILGVASVVTLALGGYLASTPTPKAGGAVPPRSTSTSTRPAPVPPTSDTDSDTGSTAAPSSSTSSTPSRSTSTSTGNSGGFAQPAPVQQTQQTPQSTTRAS